MKKAVLFLILFTSLGYTAYTVVTQWSSPPNEQRSFYLWKTELDTDSASNVIAQNLGVNHFYVRYFDIDWSEGYGQAIPKGEISNNYNYSDYEGYLFRKPQQITPVIFITNRTFERIDDKDLPKLVENVKAKTYEITKEIASSLEYAVILIPQKYTYATIPQSVEDSLRLEREKFKRTFHKQITEYQIDCDWTEKTKEKYFKFLRLYKKTVAPAKLSITLRLYPYKYDEKMGVPPVDKAMLMCYNTGQIQEVNTQNSIFSYQNIAEYITRKKPYPLQLDVALPIFDWAVWFRNGKYKGLIHETQQSWADDTSLFVKNNQQLQFKKDTVFLNNYFREGDILRWEKPKGEELEKVMTLLSDNKVVSHPRIAFFEWDTLNIKQYEKEILSIYKNF